MPLRGQPAVNPDDRDLMRIYSGAPNDRFLSNAFRRCFRFSGVLLKLYRSILGCAKKYLSVRIF